MIKSEGHNIKISIGSWEDDLREQARSFINAEAHALIYMTTPGKRYIPARRKYPLFRESPRTCGRYPERRFYSAVATSAGVEVELSHNQEELSDFYSAEMVAIATEAEARYPGVRCTVMLDGQAMSHD